MPLPGEVPFTAEELVEIEQLVRSVLTPIQLFTHQATAAVIPPDVFLLLPAHQERLEILIDCFTLICDLLPPDYFEYTKWELLECRDRLYAVEASGTLASQSPPLFGSLGVEIGPKGYYRLALPREVIEIMIAEGAIFTIGVQRTQRQAYGLEGLAKKEAQLQVANAHHALKESKIAWD
ncbi:hypothetical protein FS837_012637 [Tulasnella sp. UAMH 9824]|nr:hypothetical protein FS837_012637 [Tulasnella sp. UAMH 9824]